MKQIQVNVSSSTNDLMGHLVDFVKAVKAAIADGWSMKEGIPEIIEAAVQDIAPAIKDAADIGAESQEKDAFVKALMLGTVDLAGVFIPAWQPAVVEAAAQPSTEVQAPAPGAQPASQTVVGQ